MIPWFIQVERIIVSDNGTPAVYPLAVNVSRIVSISATSKGCNILVSMDSEVLNIECSTGFAEVSKRLSELRDLAEPMTPLGPCGVKFHPIDCNCGGVGVK